jgi:CRP-like cAMP-binding protein/transposase
MNPPTNLYVVILGRVKVSSTNGNGRQSVSRIVRTEGLFGESCLIGASRDDESATALDNVMLMGWDRAEIEKRILQEPRLGIALLQYMVHQCVELQDRIETMAVHKTPERVMLGLLQLATDLGTETEGGSTRIAHLTHDTIAEFVGTSREIISCQMNRLRRLGLIRYSRKYLDVDSRALLDELKRQEIFIPRGTRKLLKGGLQQVRVVLRALSLLQLAENASAPEIAKVIPLTPPAVRRLGHRYQRAGLEGALYERQRPGAAEVLEANQKQRIIAMVCSDPPVGSARWTVRLVAEEAVKRKLVPRVGRETIRILLLHHDLNIGDKAGPVAGTSDLSESAAPKTGREQSVCPGWLFPGSRVDHPEDCYGILKVLGASTPLWTSPSSMIALTKRFALLSP